MQFGSACYLILYYVLHSSLSALNVIHPFLFDNNSLPKSSSFCPCMMNYNLPCSWVTCCEPAIVRCETCNVAWCVHHIPSSNRCSCTNVWHRNDRHDVDSRIFKAPCFLQHFRLSNDHRSEIMFTAVVCAVCKENFSLWHECFLHYPIQHLGLS